MKIWEKGKYRKFKRSEVRKHNKKKILRAELAKIGGGAKIRKNLTDTVYKLKIRALDKKLSKFWYLCNSENIGFEVVGSSLKPLVRAGIPKQKIIALFLNIIDNARLACQNSDKKRKMKIFCEVRIVQNKVIMLFYDTGAPMNIGIFTKIGEKYNTNRVDAAGCGIGLYSVKKTVEKYGGTVDFEGLTREVGKHLFIQFDLKNRRLL